MTDLLDSVESDEDLAYVESLLEAREQADTTTTKQRATMERLTQQAGSWLIGVTPRALRDLQPPRNQNGSYNALDLVGWEFDRRLSDAKKRWERESEDVSSAAVRQAEARAIKLEEQAKALQDRYVLREDVTRDLSLLFSRLDARLSSLGAECAGVAPGELKATIKMLVDERVRLAMKELAEGAAE